MNLKTLMHKYSQYLGEHDFSDLTVNGYLSDLRIFAQWFEKVNGKELTLETITPTDVKQYRQHLLLDENRTANTINRKLSSISALIHWAMEQGHIVSNPMQSVRMVRTTASAPRWLDKNEQFALQRAIERDLQLSKLRYPKRWVTRRRDASLVLFMLHTGLRLSEAVTLQVGDVHISERKGNVLVRNGKGNRQRNVPLNAEARKALQAWYEVRPESPFVWTVVEGESGAGLGMRTIQRLLNRYAQDAEIESLSPHVLRHTFGKNLMNAGTSIEKVAALLGHESLNTTRVYVKPSRQDLELAVESLA